MLIAALLALALSEPDGPSCAPDHHHDEEAAIVSSAHAHYCFDYSWPAEAAAIPALDSLLRARAAEAESWLAAEAEAFRAERLADAPDADLPPFSYEGGFGLSADTPALLALEGGTQTYTGGAHGGIGHAVLYWDKGAGREIGFADLFDDPAAALALLEGPYCADLRVQQVERAFGHEDDVWPCPALGEQPIALMAADGEGPIRMLMVMLAPYAAGSWAEGPYYVELPVTAELVRLVRPAYRAAFAAEP